MDESKALEQVFEFQSYKLEVIMHNGEPWFIGKQICHALGFKNSRQAMANLSPNQKDYVQLLDAIGRSRRTMIISEGGVYKLAFRSNKIEAEAFTDLVSNVILPAIRKTGTYTTQTKPKRTKKPVEPKKPVERIGKEPPWLYDPRQRGLTQEIVAYGGETLSDLFFEYLLWMNEPLTVTQIRSCCEGIKHIPSDMFKEVLEISVDDGKIETIVIKKRIYYQIPEHMKPQSRAMVLYED